MIVGACESNKLLTNHRRDIKPKVKVVEDDRDGFIPCLMYSDIFSLSHYKIKEIARVRRIDMYVKLWYHLVICRDFRDFSNPLIYRDSSNPLVIYRDFSNHNVEFIHNLYIMQKAQIL